MNTSTSFSHSKDSAPKGEPMTNCAVSVLHVRQDPRAKPRVVGLDWTKGILVIIMVIYHWMNYFVGADHDLYRYLRFLTPSFIFLAGFLISQVYARRLLEGQQGIPSRLVQRGVKLLALVGTLNGLTTVVASGVVADRLSNHSVGAVAWAFLTGSAPVAFSILIPIAYLLLLCAGLLAISPFRPLLVRSVTTVIIVASFACEWRGLQVGYLEMIGVGLLGVSMGYLPISDLTRLLQHRMIIVCAYAAHVWAITMWNAVFALQVISVGVNLLVIYWSGCRLEENVLKRIVIRLGEYSLFAYIAQIVILQIVRNGVQSLGAGAATGWTALLVTAMCTILAVETVDRLRRQVHTINRLYLAVFA